MAYDKKKIEAKCIEAIRKHKIAFFSYLAPYVEPTMATLYLWEFEKLDTIKKELEFNRISRKHKLIKGWEESDNPTLQVAAFKLLADENELERLSVTTTRGSVDVGLTWNETKTYAAKPETDISH